jgi:hypothetical protein
MMGDDLAKSPHMANIGGSVCVKALPSLCFCNTLWQVP